MKFTYPERPLRLTQAEITVEAHDVIRHSKSPDAEARKIAVVFPDETFTFTAETLIRPNFGMTKDKPSWIIRSVEWEDKTDDNPFFDPYYADSDEALGVGCYFQAWVILHNKDVYTPRPVTA